MSLAATDEKTFQCPFGKDIFQTDGSNNFFQLPPPPPSAAALRHHYLFPA